jgi:RND family efflux transporter MFP subunit
MGFLLLASCGHGPPPASSTSPTKVNVSLPIVREIRDYEDLTGRTDAISTVDIRARVSGYLMEVNFKDGDMVEKDDPTKKVGADGKPNKPLYLIDPRPFLADLDRAKGEVERLQGQKKLLDIEVERYYRLVTQRAASQDDLDNYLGQQAENLGALKAAQAQQERSQLNLDFTRVTAPISGKISRTLVTPGNLVTADTTLLTTIVSIDPIYVYFNLEEPTLLRIREMLRAGEFKARNINEVEIDVFLANDAQRRKPFKGRLDFANNVVDPMTGTITLRGLLPNPFKMPDQPPLLLPGMFIRLRLPLSEPHRALLVADRIIGTDQGQKYLFVLDGENKVVYRRVTLGQLEGGLRAINTGLQPDDRVVVSNLQRLRPGIEVEPQTMDMTDLLAPPPGPGGPAPAQGPASTGQAPKPAKS